MRRRHFEALRPVCPVCRSATDQYPLAIASIQREEDGHIVEGVLTCTNPQCLREYPILDGIPLLIPAIRAFVRDNILSIWYRDDLTETSESILGDCCGPGSAFDVLRQHLSSYTWDHYADLDPHEEPGSTKPGAVLRLLEQGLAAARPHAAGPILDIGCSVGRTTFALAERCGELVLGVDLHVAMLRVAARLLRQGVVRYPRRRVGLVYDRREFAPHLPKGENVDFWACDATALPFADAAFATVVGLNVLDSVQSPADLLGSVARVLAPHGRAIIACPYDWSPTATPMETWLGGHSQRGPGRGACEPVLRALLTPGAHAGSVAGLELVRELDPLAWHVRLHDRSTMTYQVHMVVVQARSS